MEFRELLSDRQFARVTVFAALAAVVILIFHLFVVGGEDFYNTFSTIAPPLVALAACALFSGAVFKQKDALAKKVWAGMALGFGMWAGAEIIWAIYALVLQQEIPYPSLADVLWIGGYIPLYYALVTRLRMLRIIPTRSQIHLIRAISIASFLLTAVVVIWPVIADFDPARLFEGLINILYPLADVGLVILAVVIITLLRQGRFSLPWQLILAGLITMGVSDLLYSYTSWQGIYLPDGEVNFISTFIDATYTLAYILCGYGVFVFERAWENKRLHPTLGESARVNRCYALMMVDRDGWIISTSKNLACILNAPDDQMFVRRPLSQVMGVDDEEVREFLELAADRKLVSNARSMIHTVDGQPREVWVTAMGMFDPENAYIGTNIAVRADLPVAEELCYPSSRELSSILNYLLKTAGTQLADESSSLRVYFGGAVQVISSFLYLYGGERFREAMFSEVERIIRQKGLPLERKDDSFVPAPELTGEELASAVKPVLNSALIFAGDVIGEQIIADGLSEYERSLSATMRKDLEKYQMRVEFLAAA